MCVELRKGRAYLYDRTRVNGRVRCEYLGPLSPAEVEYYRGRAAADRAMREAERRERDAVAERADEVLAAGAEFDRLADRVFRAVMYLTGHTLHKRSEWRRTRGAQPMATMQDTGAAPRAVPGRTGVKAEREVRALIDKAGRDDTPSLVAFRELLKNSAAVEALGFAAARTRATLVGMAAHTHPTVAAQVFAQCEEQTAKLMAGCGPEPSFAEWMAVVRVVHNWLTVHNLEALVATNSPDGAPTAAMDKRLTQAEKRLHAALKSLAVLRRLRKPVAVTQVNIAKGGPLVVNNAAPQETP